MAVWSILVIAMALIDFILMSLLARDYHTCKDDVVEVYCFMANGIAMTLAARGFVLWIFNIAAASIMLSFGIKVKHFQYAVLTKKPIQSVSLFPSKF